MPEPLWQAPLPPAPRYYVLGTPQRSLHAPHSGLFHTPPEAAENRGIFLRVAFFEARRIGLADGRNIARRGDTEGLPDYRLLRHRKLCPSSASSALSKCARAWSAVTES